MNRPWQDLDRWAFDIERGKYTKGSRTKDTRLYRALQRARDKMYGKYLATHPNERIIPARYCVDRVIPKINAGIIATHPRRKGD